MDKKPFWSGPKRPAGPPGPRPKRDRNQPAGKKDKDTHAVNEQIRAREVRLVGDNVTEGIYPLSQALKIADELELDLIEIVVAVITVNHDVAHLRGIGGDADAQLSQREFGKRSSHTP